MSRLVSTLSLFLMMAVLRTGFAQTVSGIIVGTVTGPTGAVVPNAKITVTNEGTSARTETISDL